MLRARSFDEFDAIIAFDFEFGAPPGERPTPRCVVARELRSGREWREWLDGRTVACPYPVGPRTLFIAYFASAEMGCHLALGWPLPQNVVDLYVEFRNLKNIFSSSTSPGRSGLLDALKFFGLNSIADEEKQEMRELAIRGGPYEVAEVNALMDYCGSDVDALERLFERMQAMVDVPRALLRGASSISTAKIEHQGIPIDSAALSTMREHWTAIRLDMIRKIDADYGVYDHLGSFKLAAFSSYLNQRGLLPMWPRTSAGALKVDDDTMRDMAKMHRELQPLRELRAALGELRLSDLAVGADNRNRTLVSPFAARTGRNAPSTTKGIFGSSVFLRSLIKPAPGRAVIYIDYCQQEFGIAGALAGDEHMLRAYASGDPYLAFAQQAGRAPADATKKSHPQVRELFKACVLAVQYAMGAASLAYRIGQPLEEGRQLLRLHRQTYPRFWQWSDAVVDSGMLSADLTTVFGWRVRVREDARTTSLRNFPMQGNGAEMLRLACILAHDAGVEISMPVHDALLVEASDVEVDDIVARTVDAMELASEIVLGGFRLRAQPEYVVRYPDRYRDPRGERMWRAVWDAIEEVKHER